MRKTEYQRNEDERNIMMQVTDSLIQNRNLYKYWKARTEALERALRTQEEHCYTCKHFSVKNGAEHCDVNKPCKDGQFWEFSLKRFSDNKED